MKRYFLNSLPKSRVVVLLLFIFLITGRSTTVAQKISPDQIEKVLPGTNTEYLKQLSREFFKEEKRQKEEAHARALQENWPLRMILEDGTVYELIRFEGNFPEYYTTNNHIAAQSTSTDKVHPGGGYGYELTGKGMIVGEWDESAVLETHQELTGRAFQRDNASGYSNHATHVAGTLIGAGVQTNAKGMAYEAELWAHDWNNDASEMATAAANGLLVSNHSYGTISGWANGTWGSETTQPHWWGNPSISETEDFKFGLYNSAARSWDQIAYNAPYYLIVKSAGNDRGQNGSLGHYVNQGNGWEWVEVQRDRDGGTAGYDCIPTSGNAKNILTIGAVNDIPGGFSKPEDIVMSSFSGWGPTDDGRIKPDVVGNGVGVYSPTAAGNQSYSSYNGTSMSGPNVAGSLILLQELHRKYHGKFMRSASLKALAIHTADSATGESRPDYRNGWGLLNTKNAADVLTDRFNHKLIEETLENNETYSYNIISDGINPVKVTLVWTDVQGETSAAELNPRTPRLVNDLDLRLYDVSDDTIVYLPFILDPSNPSAPATKGDNILDNVEVVYADVIPAGEYTIVVSHKGSLTNESQSFSLVITAPLSPCRLAGTEQIISFDLLCHGGDQTISFEVEEPEEGTSPYFFSLDNENFSESNSFEDISASHGHVVYIRDSEGCYGTVRIDINTPEEIKSHTNDERLFEITAAGSAHSFNFAHAFDAGWGTNAWNSIFTSKPVLADDGSADPALGCNALANADDIDGNIAIVYRGSCEFGMKALNAQNAGARAVVIINNEAGVISMAAGAVGNQVTIPVFMISNSDGALLIDIMNNEDAEFTIGTVRRIVPSLCTDSFDGSVNPVISGGTGPYSYHWPNTGDTTRIAGNLSSGIHTLIVTDSNNCSKEFEYNVGSVAGIPDPSFDLRPETCIGANDGSLRLIRLGNNTFQLYFNGEQIPLNTTITDLSPGSYEVEYINADGCVVSDEINIEEGTQKPEISQLIVTNETCEGFNDGSVILANGTDPVISSVRLIGDNGNEHNGLVIDALAAQSYIVILTTNTGCQSIGEITVKTEVSAIQPLITGPEEFTSEESLEFSSSPSEWDGTIEWSVQGGEILSGQGTSTVAIAFSLLADKAELSVIYSKYECEFSGDLTVLNKIETSVQYKASNQNIRLYPNPANDILFADPFNINENIDRLYILSPLGVELMSVPFNNQKTEIDISVLTSGIYLIKAGNSVQKFTKI